MATPTIQEESPETQDSIPEPRPIGTINSAPIAWSTTDPFAKHNVPDDPPSSVLAEDGYSAFDAMVTYGGQDEMLFDASIDDLLYDDQDDPSLLNSSPALRAYHAADTRTPASAGASHTDDGIDYASAEESTTQIHAGVCVKNKPAPIPQWDHRLSELCFNLSKRLHESQEIDAHEESTDAPYLGTPKSNDTSVADSSLSCWSPELFSVVLQATTEYINIIQSHSYASDDNGNAGAHLVVLLNILSAYIQIITLYDGLLKGLYSQLSEKSLSPFPLACMSASSFLPLNDGEAQILPGLQIAGLNIMQGSLQARLLLDVMQHQLATMELLLGLPAGIGVMQGPKRKFSDHTQYRGSSGDNDAVGIFGEDPRARSLLAVLQTHGSGSCAVASVRDRIRDLHALVDV
ncbi:hypothetical protein K491DRAFT_720766 [Lophiostoma macrostomum CBS 122681]|uniref:Aflatoxin regulatory protein domain-containing protein n=1 Tax=Lophiostoma macrostomum CBS 122681 TaxID=1314788 RepID=A0A6A6SRG6_9PLEO|nr:hypothetical protein K491DRAFT_720766 [Lophiostoma macrostomum CBS 122681]